MAQSLKTIKANLQKISDQFNWTYNVDHSTGYGNLSNLIEIRNMLNSLWDLNLFSEVVNRLRSSAIFTSSGNSLRIIGNESVIVDSDLKLLKSLITNFLTVLTETVPEESIDSINIKLPPVNDFDELSKVSRDIHLAISQVIFNDEINGQTKIVSVENGSIWLNVLVGTTAVSVIASLVWSGAVIYKKILEGKLLEQQIRSLKVKNDSLEDILKAQKAETDLLIIAESEHVNSEFFTENTPENLEKIKNSITIFAELISKGAEIQPALVAPENVSNLFPDPTNLIGLESKIKRLTGPSKN